VEATRSGFVLKRQSTEIRQVVAGFHSSQVPVAETRYRGDNVARYQNPELDALLERFQVTVPQEPRLAALGEALRFVSANAIALPLTHDSQPTLISNQLLNAFGKGEGETTSVWNIHEWDLR
jgi:ABC-type transport system substrate-binding protein